MASRLWQFLSTHFPELPAAESVKETTEAAKAVFELADVLQKEGPNVEALGPLISQVNSLLDVLNSPLADIVEKSVPFLPIATGLLKFCLERSKKPLTLENSVALVSQAAYLESLKKLLQDEPLLSQIGSVPASGQVMQLSCGLADLELSEEAARKAITNFPSSVLAQKFGELLSTRLVQAGLSEAYAHQFTERVAWYTPRYMNQAWAASAEALKHLGQPTFTDWRQEQAKYQDIDDYLTEVIRAKPNEPVFDEKSLTFRDIYVPMQIRRLDRDGKPIENALPVDLEDWVSDHLQRESAVLFIQGEAGRGKSVFCRMFADRVRATVYPAYIPILIRLRDLGKLESALTQTLETRLETRDFAKGDRWLTDDNTRFLFLLDGFDELLMEGRDGGLKEFLRQVEQFQTDSHHRFLITGRPLSLQGIEREISQRKNLERVELQPLSDQLRERWYQQWAAKFGQAETDAFRHFLSVCPQEIHDSLAREPLLLYLLGRMHREQRLRAEMFAGVEGIDAKLVIYDQAVRWVIEKQREDENYRQAGLESEDLRRVLREAAVCVVQSGNEVTKVAFLEARLKDGHNPVYDLLQKARKRVEVEVSEQKLLNNLLTTFYLKPASDDREGSVEFVHKSFGEFLFAERLKDALEDWSQQSSRRGKKYLVPDEEMWKEIYDLLGYGGLTYEVMDYLRGLLNQSNFDPVQLFERLQDFYLRWWAGEFIDALSNNLPQGKMRCLREQIPEREPPLGLRQVDTLTGYNVMILLFELHRYGQSREDLQDLLTFYPCGKPDSDEFDKHRLYRIIGYGECLNVVGFLRFVAPFLSRTNLSDINLNRADLLNADLSNANLSNADLFNADLSNVNLSNANLSGADLSNVNLSNANLSGADLSNANLRNADLFSAYLFRANLSNANLSSADLFSAYLFNADLRSADLFSAYLSNANLFWANLSSADLTNADLDAMSWDERTEWANARGLHEARNVPVELAKSPKFAAATALSRGVAYAEAGNIPDAIAAYQEAQIIDSEIEISAHSWNILCWMGCLHGYAADVLFAGEKAVSLSDEYENYQESRGLARALTGDLEGAAADFQVALDRSPFSSKAAQWKRWLAALRAGENPFTPEELEFLRRNSDA